MDKEALASTIPYASVRSVSWEVDLGTDHKLLQLEIVEPAGKNFFADYRLGKFAFVSAFGKGEEGDVGAPLV